MKTDEPNSFAKRHNLPIPPIISRKTRRERRAQESNQTGEELDAIIEQAKSGEDPNARLRSDLVLGEDTYYDRNSYPWEYAWQGDAEGNKTGLPVEMDINFHRVFDVDVVSTHLDLIVWFELNWVDPRLTWDPKEYGNHSKTWFWINGNAGGEMSEIWTPDIELWNLDEGLADSLEDAYAVVSYDGSVSWNRPGHLRPACKYKGLERFPFDKLECTIELGSWSYSWMYLTLAKGGPVSGDQKQREKATMVEDPISCEVKVYSTQMWDMLNEESLMWPVMLYNVTLERAWQPYARDYIFSQILLIIIGFSAFWLPPSCGERMGLSITAMLASITSDIVIAANLPQAKAMTWFQKFSLLNSSFTFLSLMESVVVLYFFYKRSDTIVPKHSSKPMHTHTSKSVSGAKKYIRRTILMAPQSNSLAQLSNSFALSEEGTRDEQLEEEIREENDEPSLHSVETAQHLYGNERHTDRARSSIAMRDAARALDADDFLNEGEAINNLKWKEYAVKADYFSRFWFPLAYSIALAIIWKEIT
eukprot:scaffold48787_cov89-Cyclotella_meneghiniana.AAC.6